MNHVLKGHGRVPPGSRPILALTWDLIAHSKSRSDGDVFVAKGREPLEIDSCTILWPRGGQRARIKKKFRPPYPGDRNSQRSESEDHLLVSIGTLPRNMSHNAMCPASYRTASEFL